MLCNLCCLKTRLRLLCNHGVRFVIKTIRITSKVRLHCNKTRSFGPIKILITNQTKSSIDLVCFDCLRQTKTSLVCLAENRTRLSSTGSELIEMECQQMKSNENEITTHFNGSFAVPFTMTIKTIVISNQDCFDGEWNALNKYQRHRSLNLVSQQLKLCNIFIFGMAYCSLLA